MRLTKRLALVIVAAVTPVIAVEIYNAYALIEQARQEKRATALQYSRQASWELSRLVDGLRGVMTTVAATPQVHEGDWAACDRFIDGVRVATPGLLSIAIADLNGAVRCGMGALEGVNVRERAYFREILGGKTMFKIGTYTLGPVNGRPFLPFATPVKSADGTVTAVVIAALDLQWLNQSIEQRGVPPEGSLTVADADGVILARQPKSDQFVGTRIPEQYQYLLHEDHAGAIEVTSQDGTPRTLGYQPLAQPPLGLYVSAGLPAGSDTATYYAMFRALFVAFTAGTIAILVAWYISRRFVAAPVAALVDVADRWRKGDLTARAQIEGDDEFARLSQAFDQAIEQAKRREDRITLLVKEITHRVKNQMSVMASMARQSGRTASNVTDFQKAFSNRIMALARSHDLVFADSGEARLRNLIEAQLAPFAGSGRMRLSGPEILIDPQATQYLGMGLHELATNAVKYGALSKEGGYVEVVWEVLPVEGVDTLRLIWSEHDGPPPAAAPAEGFGTVVLDKIVGSALGGRTTYRLDPEGAVWSCEFAAHFTVPAPVAELREPA